jgi:hypothetical protein
MVLRERGGRFRGGAVRRSVLRASLLLAALAALGACQGPSARTTDLDHVLESLAPVLSNATPGSLRVVVLRVRPPAREEGLLAPGQMATLIPTTLNLERPRAPLTDPDDPLSKPLPFQASDLLLCEPVPAPPATSSGEPVAPRPPLYAPLVGKTYAFACGGELAIGWAHVGPRVWVRSCRHGKSGNVDVVFAQDEVGCAERVWLPGVDTLFRTENGHGIKVGDPGHEGLSLVVVTGTRAGS